MIKGWDWTLDKARGQSVGRGMEKGGGGVSWSASFMLIEGNLGNTAVKGNSQSCRLFVYRKSL